ncbi:hypothetical protein PR003_g21212 [Phytophthora rubi]|uniref:Uncharacterized protein n=1 Tax=Phytophthora rubi TaxID=129364 RepID=A0A6A4DJN0_9STRA|nr:hypothetical protein PR002_g20700 [Phytophthora rubi]KAE8995308.1 hypothetical protein PR001_g20161 [Phytophthora rubi]KAE9306560.1 hypothetical protein PR003_g21212 [Phytophthora rubi]
MFRHLRLGRHAGRARLAAQSLPALAAVRFMAQFEPIRLQCAATAEGGSRCGSRSRARNPRVVTMEICTSPTRKRVFGATAPNGHCKYRLPFCAAQCGCPDASGQRCCLLCLQPI